MRHPAPPTALHMGKGKIASVVAVLGERIVAGDYAADAPLPVEADLAQSLDVGRSVLREAVKVLAAKGMVLARPRGGHGDPAARGLEPVRP
jgi:GntR family galactonate operon transcriptional repressor